METFELRKNTPLEIFRGAHQSPSAKTFHRFALSRYFFETASLTGTRVRVWCFRAHFSRLGSFCQGTFPCTPLGKRRRAMKSFGSCGRPLTIFNPLRGAEFMMNQTSPQPRQRTTAQRATRSWRKSVGPYSQYQDQKRVGMGSFRGLDAQSLRIPNCSPIVRSRVGMTLFEKWPSNMAVLAVAAPAAEVHLRPYSPRRKPPR